MERRQTKSGQVIELAHDGYARRFGLIHERTLALTNDGVRFIGQERLVVAPDVVRQPRRCSSCCAFICIPVSAFKCTPTNARWS